MVKYMGWWSAALVLLCLPLTQVMGSVQPDMDNVYGNTVTLNEGNASIWNGAMDETQFKNTLYAVDAQYAPDYVTWTQDTENGRNLTLTSTSHWANGAITHKFVAPSGKQFSGGTLKFRGGGIWGGPSYFVLRTHSAYGNNSYGLLEGWRLGTIYSTDNHSFTTDWAMEDWTVTIPANVTEFYMSVEAGADWHWAWGNALWAENVTLTDLPRLQPNMDNVYGNSVELDAGAAIIIWNWQDTLETLIAKTYATDNQQADTMTWTQDLTYNRNLLFTSNSWANGAITHKIVAPAGKQFSGGTITFQGCGIWGGAPNFNVRTSSAYANNGYGDLDIGGLGTIYGSDTHSFTTDWTMENWTVNIPTGVTEFYISIQATADWHTTWGSSLIAYDVAVVNIPGIQPEVDNVYGNSMELQAGNTVVWDGSFTKAQLLAKTYATDAQQADTMSWTQNESNGRNLQLISAASWANGTITHKFVAPTGKQFTGGTIVFTGCGIWGGAPNFELYAASAYANNGFGDVDPSGLGTIYGSDTHSFTTDWTMHNWTVNVPTGVTEFYVSIRATADYHYAWGQSLVINNVTLGNYSAGGTLVVIPDSQQVNFPAGTTTFDVANGGSGSMSWTAEVVSGAEWLSITNGSSGTDAGTITVSFTQNDDTANSRTGTIRIAAPGAEGSPIDVTVVQAAHPLPGDANLDGRVNFSDYLVLSQNFGMTEATWEQADFNGDGVVNFSDYLILSQNFGSGGAVSAEEVAKFQAASADLVDPSSADATAATLPCTPVATVVLAALGLAFGLLNGLKIKE